MTDRAAQLRAATPTAPASGQETEMRGGTHFDDDARDAMTGAFSAPGHPPQHDHSSGDAPEPTQGGTMRGYSTIHQGWVVDGFDDTVSVFQTEAAARAWCAGTWKPE